MITLTPQAAALDKKIFKKRGDATPHLRVYVSGRCGNCNGVGVALSVTDAPLDIDIVRVSRGVRVITDKYGGPLLRGSTLRVVKTEDGPAFRLDNPNSSCSCHGH